MGFFNNFPYTNFHELNSDWLVKISKEVSDKVDDIAKQNDEYQKNLDSKISEEIQAEVRKLVNESTLSSVILDYVSANLKGFTPENPDVDLLNELVASKKTVYVGSGEYRINKPIVIPQGCKLIFDGNISSLAISKTFHIIGSEAYLYVRSMKGTGTGTAIYTESTNDTIGNIVVDAPYIGWYNTAIHLFANNGTGIQNCEYNLNRIDSVNIGIHLQCGDNGLNWINQNTFTSFWVACHNTVGAIGIKFTKGAEQTDRFNGNSFTEFSCEATQTIVDIDFAYGNSFDGFRFMENTGERSIVCSSSCESNEFRSVDSYTSPDYISDKGIDNKYRIRVPQSDYFTFFNGSPVPLDRGVPTIVSDGSVSPWAYITSIEPVGGKITEISLSMRYSVEVFAESPIILKMPQDGTVILRSWNGTLLFTNGGGYPDSTAGILPQYGKTYMLYLRGSNNWGAVQID